MSDNDFEMTVEELKECLDRGDDLLVVDVREPNEIEICRLEGSLLIPMSEFGNRFEELDPEREMVIHCRSGARSARVVQFLLSKGYTKVKNLSGGILAWAKRIDPAMPTY